MKISIAMLGSVEEAAGVRELFLEVYGREYPVDLYYQPEELWRAHQSGETVCAVALDEEGLVVGNVAAYRSAPTELLYEIGAGLVGKRARGGRVASDLAKYLIEELKTRRSSNLVFGEAVCNHRYSQRALSQLGFVETALEVDLMPAEAYVQEQSAEGRVSTVLSFLPLDDGSESLYLPKRYEEELHWLYQGLDLRRTFEKSQDGPPSLEQTEHNDLRIEMAGLLRLQVRRLGRDLPQLLDSKAQVFQLILALDDPHLNFAVETAHSRGFFFGGLLPRWVDQDALMLQRLESTPNWESIKLYGVRSEQMLERIRRDYERLSSKAR